MESLDDCWFCATKNMSHATICELCTAEHAPSKPSHMVRSFGEHAATMHCKLRGTLLPDVVQYFRTTTLVAIRVGVYQNRAIIIKDANGSVRGTTRVDPNMQSLLTITNDTVTDFLNAAQIMLQNDPSPDTGSGLYPA